MTRRRICNEDLKINFDNKAGPPDLVYTGNIGLGTYVVTFQTSAVEAPPGKQTCRTSVAYTFNVASYACPHTSATYNFVAGTGTINATSTRVRIVGRYPLRRQDAGTCAGSWTLKASPYTPVACSCTTEIAVSGQSMVLAE